MFFDKDKNVPKNWIKTKLGAVTKLVYGKNLPTKDFLDNGYDVFGANGIIGKHSKYLYEAPQVLISCRGAYSGKINMSPPKAFVTNNSIVCEFLDYDLCDVRYFFYMLQNADRTKIVSGSAQPQVTVKDAINLDAPIAPINEQKRIVDKIERLFSNLDEGEALLKQVQKQLATYRQAVLKAAVTGALIGAGADEWKEFTVGQLLTDIRYGTAKKCSFDPSKTPVLRIPNVAGGKIDLSDLKHTDFTEVELKKLRLESGDILIVRSNGSVSLVGLSAIVTNSAVGYAYAGYLIRLRLKRDIIIPDFLNLFLHSPIVRGSIELHARSTSGVHNINSDEVKAITLRVPPIPQQEAIVSKVEDAFSQIDVLENWCATELKRSATLRQSILKDAFSGKLVPQNPTDEPASELLKRIQEGRCDAKTPKKQFKHKAIKQKKCVRRGK